MEAYEEITPTEKINDDTFATLVKQETQLKEIFPNAVYLKNSF